ncbi:hypothetical protein [Propionivibrio sp.]|uniref:hypothetical protein n=1 Tax=Propionivibrio sp. TaxID=2212460 RepID=UPI003BEF9A80
MITDEINADARTPAVLALAQAASVSKGSIQAAADVCKAAGFRVGRSNLSRYLNNDLATFANVEAAIVACFDRCRCPYLGMEVEAEHCRRVNTGPVPTWDPSAIDQRRTCQTCPNKPVTESTK